MKRGLLIAAMLSGVGCSHMRANDVANIVFIATEVALIVATTPEPPPPPPPPDD